MTVSALDLARMSGVCWGEPNGRPEFETWQLGGKETPRGKRGTNLMRKIIQHIEYVKPRKIIIEAPIDAAVLAKIGSTQDTTIALQGYVMIAEAVAFSRGVPTVLIERQTALQHFTGRKSYPKSLGKDAPKKACMARATQLRWVCANYDEADAGALWWTGCALEDPRAFALANVETAVKHSRKRYRR